MIVNARNPGNSRAGNNTPLEVLHGLLKRWADCFEAAARSDNRPGIVKLFAPDALICGIDKTGPFDRIMSKSFKFNFDKAKLSVFDEVVMGVLPWESPSIITNGPMHHGWTTLLAGLEMDDKDKKIFVCYHAHFSMTE